jgi:CubicO group peptidase (beta-lactamase class C family)
MRSTRRRGRIRSVDDLAAVYVPALSGTEYGRTSLRHLLQMSSGIGFSENYSGNDDVMRLVFDTYLLQGAGGVGAVTSFNERERPARTKFSYASVETQVLGLVLRPDRTVPRGLSPHVDTSPAPATQRAAPPRGWSAST